MSDQKRRPPHLASVRVRRPNRQETETKFQQSGLTIAITNPVINAIQWVIRKTLGLFGIKLGMEMDVLAAHEEIRGAVEYHHAEGLVETRDRYMLGGVLDLGDPKVETPKKVAERIRKGLKHVPAERLIPAPDCGMKYLPREVAFGKLKAMSEGAAMVRAELS